MKNIPIPVLRFLAAQFGAAVWWGAQIDAKVSLVEVEQALPLPEPESGVSWTTGIGLVALVVILGAAFAKYKCKK